ncbi:ABC transporter ATP-binding protein [Chelativorans salis]|uniref:ABC transporter ATP-binding protein n=1 Tax=Chelativorans salis TaxID=2978478 RepID=A0ABT2LVA5_9HYPH|nr:ABC transporter ATP-binding protein [Chelativorans sp. EGI FJ00035]MCT7378467.1 ABC transporter ATP-binding protein [Chelativorans sp. EGI FJ00035]
MSASPLLDVRDVSKVFTMGGVLSRKQIKAVNEVSFALSAKKPEIFTIIGESGSGKTTLARMILGSEVPTSGELLFEGKDIAARRGAERLAFMARVQPIFQNPFEAFNPLKRVDRYLASTARRFLNARTEAEMEGPMDEALQHVGLSLREVKGRFPHELSGGQLQRTAIARALISKPSVIVADEPVSMVDASLRMAIVNLFKRLRNELGVTIIYITHDLATAYYISDRIIIMQKGHVVEMGPARPILEAPQHPYSQLLKRSVLSFDGAGGGRITRSGREEVDTSAEALIKGRLKPAGDGRLVRVG